MWDSTLDAVMADIALSVKRLIAEDGFSGSCPLQKQSRIEFISHTDSSMHLDHVVRHVMQELANLAFSQ